MSNPVIVQNFMLIIIGCLGMLISLVLGIYVFKKERITEYINLTEFRNGQLRRKMAKQQKTQQLNYTTSGQSLNTSQQLNYSTASQSLQASQKLNINGTGSRSGTEIMSSVMDFTGDTSGKVKAVSNETEFINVDNRVQREDTVLRNDGTEILENNSTGTELLNAHK